MSSDTVEVAVIGGGPAGAATALRLALGGVDVRLVEASRYERPRMGETLPPVVNPMLRELGVWTEFLDLDPVPSHETASAWGGDEITERSYLFSPYGSGWHVERARFDEMLFAAAARAGAVVAQGTRVHEVRRTAGGVEVQIRTGAVTTTFRAAAVVDATGRGARIACQLGAHRIQLDRLVSAARVYALPPDEPRGDTFLEATPDGWWYVSPLPTNRRMVAFFTDARQAARAQLGTEAGWLTALTKAGHTRRLTVGTPVGAVRIVNAASHELRPCIGPDWVAVGDAALAVDPLSSGGTTFGLRTAAAATDVLLGGPPATFADLVGDAANEYRRLRGEIYSWEQRFATAPFWRSRTVHAEPADVAP